MRREHKDEARRAREVARRRARRRATSRRALRFAALIAVGMAVAFFLLRAPSPEPLPATAVAAARAAGCTGVQTPPGDARGGLHLPSGQPYTYPTEPATDGYHDPSPLPSDPHVYTSMPPETRLVHNLEHAFVNIYYRADAPDALPQPVIARLATFANAHDRTILSPHTGLPAGMALAFTAWDKLLTCRANVTPDQAAAIALGWWESFHCTSNAPEAPPRGFC